MKTSKIFLVGMGFAVFGASLALGSSSSGGSCSVAGQADSYVLALSWQPAFCKTVNNKSGKPECDVKDPNAYQAKNFTLHGLWPNRNQCGINYGFCGPVHQAVQPFTNYPQVSMDNSVRQSLGEVMPSVTFGSALERHEWYKHGTCSQLPADAYFSTAQNLVRQFNSSGVSDFMAANLGKSVAVSDFLAVIDQGLGQGTSSHAHLTCEKGLLVDVQLDLVAPLTAGASLTQLVQGSGKGSSARGCGDSFTILPIN